MRTIYSNPCYPSLKSTTYHSASIILPNMMCHCVNKRVHEKFHQMKVVLTFNLQGGSNMNHILHVCVFTDTTVIQKVGRPGFIVKITLVPASCTSKEFSDVHVE